MTCGKLSGTFSILTKMGRTKAEILTFLEGSSSFHQGILPLGWIQPIEMQLPPSDIQIHLYIRAMEVQAAGNFTEGGSCEVKFISCHRYSKIFPWTP